ncbi:MAG: hypothetical protein QXK37_04570 [Candidatus Woesearchaeota archaeon]
MSEEIMSKRTIAVLLVLSIMLSVFGTLAVLNYLEEHKEPQIQYTVANRGEDQGAIKLQIVQPEEKKEASTTGFLSLEVVNEKR